MHHTITRWCELVCFGVKILNFVYFGVKKSGISVFLVSAENGAGVNKKTNNMEIVLSSLIFAMVK